MKNVIIIIGLVALDSQCGGCYTIGYLRAVTVGFLANLAYREIKEAAVTVKVEQENPIKACSASTEVPLECNYYDDYFVTIVIGILTFMVIIFIVYKLINYLGRE
jgi:hypothetical protein